VEACVKAFDLGVKRWLFFFTHPDDEISIVAWIKRLCDAGATVHCAWTVSKPVREAEARAMIGSIGVPQENMHFFEAPDGDACDHIPEIIEFAKSVIETAQPDRIALGAFECGHIDHDSTNVAVAHANRQRVPMFEIPFYHTYLTRIPVINRFADPSGAEVIQLDEEERKLKIRASRAYKTQNIGSLLFWYSALSLIKMSPQSLHKTERMRLQTHFDYAVPNLPKHLRTRVEVSAKFHRFRKAIPVTPISECNSSANL
jgi:LmbE family N-acetylglucosaminyl deacetylase